MRRRQYIAGTAICAAVFTAIPYSVAQDATAQATQSAGTAGAAAEQSPQINNNTLQERVNSQFKQDPVLQQANISASVQEGRIVLSGTVPHYAALNRAVKVAESIRGVAEVDSAKLRVKSNESVGTTNDQLKETVKQALREDAATGVYNDLEITADDGRIVVAGSVPNPEDVELVRSIISEVRGVENVDVALSVGYSVDSPGLNRLYPEGRDASTIAQDVRSRLAIDAYVDSTDIDVRVEDGVVYLSGQVGSASKKSHAVYDATIAGTGRVDASELKVERWPAELAESFQEQEKQQRTDEALQVALRNALQTNARVPDDSVEAKVSDGVVTLTGHVDNLAARREATRVARSINGVKEVTNSIEVRAKEQPDDELLGAQVRNALRRNASVDMFDIDASVEQGQVTLTGEVDSIYEKAQAEQVASRIKGVKSIDNNLSVKDTAVVVAYDPYVDTWDWRDSDWWLDEVRTHTAVRTGDELVEAVESQYFWSPFVDGEDISISAQGDRVVLDGTVDSIYEAQAAEANALEAGAGQVTSNLIIQ